MDFNRPPCVGTEIDYISDVLNNGQLIEYGQYVAKCAQWLRDQLNCPNVLLTSSCTHALEIAALLLDIQPGDEIIMPSYTFVSTANAFVLRGGVPVFVDIRPDTLNLDERLIEAAITPKTRAIVPVHYAGVSCEMDAILACAHRHGVAVVEDAAQGIQAAYKGRALGTLGALGTLSFDIMKNLSAAGQGGALMINDAQFTARAEILLHKGTNRVAFQRGEVSHYEWKDMGSYYTMSALSAAYLYGNLEAAAAIGQRRMEFWNGYRAAFLPLAEDGRVRLQTVPAECQHNAHIFSLRLNDKAQRDAFIKHMRKDDIPVLFHYVPLHEAPGGKRFGRAHSTLDVTINTSDTLVRLPLFYGLTADEHRKIIHTALRFF